ncbi:MAG: Nudix family hydrolase [Pseudomonadota bacterium]
MPNPLHVVAAAIFNPSGDVLIALRHPDAHQGGLWEFPGGKIETGEDIRHALKRELHEELGINVTQARPLIRIHHNYPDKSVLLEVWRVDAFDGEPHGREGQPIAWVSPQHLPERAFPQANQPIITAVRLPPLYLITPETGRDWDIFLRALDRSLGNGITLVQLRAKTLSASRYKQLAKEALPLCRARQAQLLLNAPPEWVEEVGADGVHLNSMRLMALESRPLPAGRWVAASCHNTSEIAHACRIGIDFAVAAPVLETTSHPGAPALGWEGLRALTEQAILPVYALGGMTPRHLPQAWAQGAQGIAAIGSLWRGEGYQGRL